MVRTRVSSRSILLCRVILPAGLVLLAAASLMGYYNFRVTGNPLLMPYQVHESTYVMAPSFLWQPSRPEPQYDHQALGDLQKESLFGRYQNQTSLYGWLRLGILKIATFWMFFVGILFTPFMIALPQMWRRRSVKFALSLCALMMAASMTETYFFPHYAAPVACLFFLLIVESLRQARLAEWRGKPLGRPAMRAIVPVLLISSIASYAIAQHLMPASWHLERAKILRDLEQGPEHHLVLVRYGPDHRPHEQWIYNRANIDAAKVVWAWEMGPQADKELLDYFKDRKVWLLEAERRPRRLTPYLYGLSDK